LSRGFVDGPVVLTYGPLLTDISLGIDNTSVVVNAEKGEIVITGPDLRGQYMEASYTAGFEPDANDSDVYGGVPEWLTEIATLAAMMALDANTPDVRFEKGDQGLSSARNLQRQIQTRISTKARFFPSATHPL
jgi:hypothetical protein